MSRRKLVVGNGLLNTYSSASNVDMSFHTLASDDHIKAGTDISDTLMSWKYLFIFCNAMLGVFLMILELQVAWDGTQLQYTKSARTLRFLITFLTILLLVQLLDYYNGLLSVMTNSWKYARINTGFNISVWSVLRSSPVARMFWTELILCSLHAPPIHGVNDKWGLMMFVRFYMVFRLIRDRSIIYNRRNTIMRKYQKYGIKHWGPPKFDWFLSTKSLFVRRPFPFVIALTLWVLWVCAHCIYIFERESDPSRFHYWGCLYLSMISMITGWPTDTYEYFWPNTVGARAACIMSTLLGLFLLTMLLEVFTGWFVATPHQRPAIVWSHRQDIKQQLRESAARIIQLVWRKHALTTLKPSASRIGNTKARCNLTPQSMGTRYVNAVKEFRRLMRQKVSLQINFESQTNNIADEPSAPGNQIYSDDDSYVADNGQAEVEERLRAMEALIHTLTRKIDTLVGQQSAGPRDLPVEL